MRRWSPGPVVDGKVKMVSDPTGDFVLFDELPREQRRYEIAKDQLGVWRHLLVREALDMTREEMAREALRDADALLAELERENGVS